MRTLTVRQFADRAAVPSNHIWAHICTGRIKSCKRNGKRLIPEYELQKFIAERKPLSQRLDELQKHFTAKYGRGAFNQFVRFLKDGSLTLAKVGRKFNLSRERVRQVAEYVGYGSLYRKGVRHQRLVEVAAEKDTVLKFVKERCEMFGLPFQPIKLGGRWTHSCFINDKKVAILQRRHPFLTSPHARTPHTYIKVNPRLKDHDSFVVLIHHDGQIRSYVVPRRYYQGRNFINVPASPFVYPRFGQKESRVARRHSKGIKAEIRSDISRNATYQFLESWHLLR